MSDLSIHVTDFASYSCGLQFATENEYNLYNYESIEDLLEDIKLHYRKTLEKDKEIERLYRSNGINIEELELMISNVSIGLMNYLSNELDAFNYRLIELIIDNIEEVDRVLNGDIEDLLEYYNSTADCPIYPNEKEFFEMYNDDAEELARKVHYGRICWTDKWIFLSGDGNFESCDDLEEHIDRKVLLDNFFKLENDE